MQTAPTSSRVADPTATPTTATTPPTIVPVVVAVVAPLFVCCGDGVGEKQQDSVLLPCGSVRCVHEILLIS